MEWEREQEREIERERGRERDRTIVPVSFAPQLD